MDNIETIKSNELDGESEKEKKKIFQISILKAYMICIVIFDHSIPYNITISIGGMFWERIVIPIILIIMSFNLANSFKRNEEETAKEIFNKNYFRKKFVRLGVPYLIFYSISVIIWIVLMFNAPTIYIDPYYDDKIFMFIGYTPLWGPGMWFLPIVFSGIIIIPILYHFFLKEPILTLVLCFSIEFILHLITHLIFGIIGSNNAINFFYCNILLYLGSIGMGLWLSNNQELKDKQNKFILILLPLSIIYFIEYTFFGFSKYLFLGDFNLLTVPYAAFIVLIALKYLPETPQSKLSKFIEQLGNSTYHILLFQILYFSIIYHLFPNIAFNGFGTNIGLYILYFLVNIFITISGGMFWYSLETSLIRYRKFNEKK